MRELTKIFKALSDSNRLRILKMLEVRPLCVCEITAVLKLATSTVSKHLSILRDAEFIIDEKEGKWVNYALSQVTDKRYVSQLLTLIQSWLPDEETIKRDKELVKVVDRNVVCGK